MIAILKQRHFLLKKDFELTENGLKIKISKPFSYIEDEFTYEQLICKTKRKKAMNGPAAVITLVALLAYTVAVVSHFTDKKSGSGIADILFYIILIVGLLAVNYFTYENLTYMMLVDNRYISFYSNSPNYISVDEFLQRIKVEQKAYLLNRYAKSDPYLSFEQITNNLQWLWDRRIIDDNELNDLRNQLLSRHDESKSVGFRTNAKTN